MPCSTCTHCTSNWVLQDSGSLTNTLSAPVHRAARPVPRRAVIVTASPLGGPPSALDWSRKLAWGRAQESAQAEPRLRDEYAAALVEKVWRVSRCGRCTRGATGDTDLADVHQAPLTHSSAVRGSAHRGARATSRCRPCPTTATYW